MKANRVAYGAANEKLAGVPGIMTSIAKKGIESGAKGFSEIAPQEAIQKSPTPITDAEPNSPQSRDPGKQSRSMYELSDNELKTETAKLARNPRYTQAVQYLNEAIDTGNLQKKNAVLFRLMQDPAARKELRGEP